jgi:predicted Zn-dependent protease
MKHQLVVFLSTKRGVRAAEAEIKTLMKDNPDRSDPVDWLVALYLSHDMNDQLNAFLDHVIAQNDHDQLWLHAMTAKAKVEYLKQDNDQAGKLVAAVLVKDPNNADAQFLKAHVEADEGQYDQATIDLRGIIRDKPKSKEAYELLSEILLREGHTDLAIDTLNQLSDVALLSDAQQVRLAQIYALNGDTKHAQELLLAATKSNPKYPVGWEMTARLDLDVRNFADAESAIETLDTLPHQHLTALLLKGEEQQATDKIPDAIATYMSVINADPTAPQAEHALDQLIPLYLKQKQLPEAARYLETLPQIPVISTMLGECYVLLGNQDKAAAAFDHAIAEHAKTQAPYLERAKIYIAQNKTNTAFDLLHRAQLVDPTDMRAPMAQAELAEQQGSTALALELYSGLLTQHPDNNIVANNLAELIADERSDDPDLMEKARQAAERFASAQNPVLLDTLGWVYFKDGRKDEAVTILDRAAGMGQETPPQFHYHYGAILLSAHRTAEAQTQLRLATVKGADYPGLKDAEKLLSSISPH